MMNGLLVISYKLEVSEASCNYVGFLSMCYNCRFLALFTWNWVKAEVTALLSRMDWQKRRLGQTFWKVVYKRDTILGLVVGICIDQELR